MVTHPPQWTNDPDRRADMELADAFNQGRFAPTDKSGPWLTVSGDTEHHIKLMNDAEVGTKFSRFGFYGVISEGHKRPRDLEPLRLEGDELADRAFEVWLRSRAASNNNGDARSVRSNAGECPFASPSIASASESGILAELESEAALRGNAAVAAFLADSRRIPDWLDWQAIERAQDVHWRHALSIGTALLNLSLVGGFGAPHVNAVLNCTGYLAGGNRERIYTRLIETLHMIVCAFDGGKESLMPGGKGWRSVLNVRLLHSAVRSRLLSSDPRVYDPSVHGVPINQEDMIVTQLAFSVVVLMGLERTGLAATMSSSEMLDYLHAWRYIGHLIGIKPRYNEHMTSLRGAQTMLESVAWHLVAPDGSGPKLAMGVIDSVAYRPPLPWSHMQQVAITRAFMDAPYADALGLPRLDDPLLKQMAAEGAERLKRERTAQVQQAECAGQTSLGAWAKAALLSASFLVRRAVVACILVCSSASDALSSLSRKVLGGIGLTEPAPVDSTRPAADDDDDPAAFAASALRWIGAIQRTANLPIVGRWFADSSRRGMRQLVFVQLSKAGYKNGETDFFPRWLLGGRPGAPHTHDI